MTALEKVSYVLHGTASVVPDISGSLHRLSDEPHPAGKSKHGGPIQFLRLLLLFTYFIGSSCVIVATQILSSPLYLINKDLYYAAIAITKQSFGIVMSTVVQWWSPTLIRVCGDESVYDQLHMTSDGRVVTDFPERMVLIANHQIDTDWLYLWWSAYTSGMHGHIYIILKDSLRLVPILGQGMMFYEFIFLARSWVKDQMRLTGALHKLKTRRVGIFSAKKVLAPLWLLIFPEGTNLSENSRVKSADWAGRQDMPDLRHLILPRNTGLYTCLQELKGSVEWVYDCTIAYEGIPRGQYGEQFFNIRAMCMQGRPPKSVNMYWRRYAISSIPLDDLKPFEGWLLARWREKDDLMEHYLQNGRFPSFETTAATATKDFKSPLVRPETTPGQFNTEVRLAHWSEVAQIYAPLVVYGLLANLLARGWNLAVHGTAAGLG